MVPSSMPRGQISLAPLYVYELSLVWYRKYVSVGVYDTQAVHDLQVEKLE